LYDTDKFVNRAFEERREESLTLYGGKGLLREGEVS